MTKKQGSLDDEIARAVEVWLIAGLGRGPHRKRELSGGTAILSVSDAPTGATGFATCGLYRVTYPREPEVGRNRFEILAACRGDEDMSTYLATAAKIVARARQAPMEGCFICDVARRAGKHDLAKRYPHMAFLPPYFWDELDVLRLPDFTLVPVFGLPISDAESKFLVARGTKAFIELFRKSKVDAFDLAREPMVVDRGEAH